MITDFLCSSMKNILKYFKTKLHTLKIINDVYFGNEAIYMHVLNVLKITN